MFEILSQEDIFELTADLEKYSAKLYNERINTYNDILSGKVLVLNQSYEPIYISTIKKAIVLVILSKAELIAPKQGIIIHSIKQNYPYPSVIRLSRYFKTTRKVLLTRKNLFYRDDSTCQYCGKKLKDLTIDHIIPKSRGGADTWENLVTACHVCNNKKGNLTPEEANIKLLSIPRKPNYIAFLKKFIENIDENWKPFLFI